MPGAVADTARRAREWHARGTRIGYDPPLIQHFQIDHQHMLELFTQVQNLLTTRDYGGVKCKLGELRSVLQDRLMTASVKFFVYMAHLLDGDAGQTAHLDDSFAETFQIELLSIGAALVQRIEREEPTLLPLYRAVRQSPSPPTGAGFSIPPVTER